MQSHFDDQNLKTIESSLRDFVPSSTTSGLKSACALMRPAIEKARENGASWKDIASIIRAQGFPTAKASTVRQYFHQPLSAKAERALDARKRAAVFAQRKEQEERIASQSQAGRDTNRDASRANNFTTQSNANGQKVMPRHLS